MKSLQDVRHKTHVNIIEEIFSWNSFLAGRILCPLLYYFLLKTNRFYYKKSISAYITKHVFLNYDFILFITISNNTISICTWWPYKMTIVFKFHAKQLFCHEFRPRYAIMAIIYWCPLVRKQASHLHLLPKYMENK